MLQESYGHISLPIDHRVATTGFLSHHFVWFPELGPMTKEIDIFHRGVQAFGLGCNLAWIPLKDPSKGMQQLLQILGRSHVSTLCTLYSAFIHHVPWTKA